MYIFGQIDFPVFELLFITAVLMLVGLTLVLIAIVYILKEIKAFKKLITEEETDIQEFENDIRNLKDYEGDKRNQSHIKTYIKASLERGFTWQQIKNSLKAKGFSDSKLDDIFERF